MQGFSIRATHTLFFFLSFMGIVCASIGYYFLSDQPVVTAYLMIFSSGGILYLLFQDIVPESKLSNTWYPSLGATLGFLVGMIGEKII